MANDIQMQFAKRLQLLRKAQGMTQRTAADILNVSRPAYAYYEGGKAEPSLESMRRLVRLFCPDSPRYLLLLDESAESADLLCEQDAREDVPLFAELTSREQTALGMFRVMDEDKKAQAILLLSRLLNETEEEK